MQKVLHSFKFETFSIQSFKNLNTFSQLIFALSVVGIVNFIILQNDYKFLTLTLITLYALNIASILWCQSAHKSAHILTNTFQLTVISCLAFATKDYSLASLFSVFIHPALVLLFTRKISLFVICTLIQSISQLWISFQTKIVIFNDEFTQSVTITSVLLTLLLIIIISDLQKELAASESQKASLKKNSQETQDLLNFLILEVKNLTNNVLETAKTVAQEEPSCSRIANLIQMTQNFAETMIWTVSDHLQTEKTERNTLPTNMRQLFEQLWRIASENFKRSNTKGHIKIQTQVPAVLQFHSQCFVYAFLDIISSSASNNSVKILVEWIREPSKVPKNQKINDSFSLLQVACERRIQDPYIVLNHYDKEIKTKFGLNDGGSGSGSKGMLRVTCQDIEMECNTSRSKILTNLYRCQQGDIKIVNNNKTAILEFPCVVVTAREQLKVIIADEDYESADILADYVEKMEGVVKGKVRNGLEAYMSFVKSAKEKEYIDAVIIDLNLPIIEGKFLCKKIRAYEMEHNLAPCRIVIVAKELNYHDLNALTDHNREYKAQCFLKKPVTFDKLKDYLGIGS